MAKPALIIRCLTVRIAAGVMANVPTAVSGARRNPVTLGRPEPLDPGFRLGDGPIFMLQAHDKIGQTRERKAL